MVKKKRKRLNKEQVVQAEKNLLPLIEISNKYRKILDHHISSVFKRFAEEVINWRIKNNG